MQCRMKGYFVLLLVMIYNSKVNGKQFTCSSLGRFPNPIDPTCKTYIRCVDVGVGSYVQTTYQCPSSLFDPITQECSTTYMCTRKTFECTSSGRFADPNDTTCRKYYYCFDLFFTFFKLSYKCPNSNFDPQIGKCSPDYLCPHNSLHVTEAIETTSTTIPTTTTPHITTNTVQKLQSTTASPSPSFVTEISDPITTQFQQISTSQLTIEASQPQISPQWKPVFKCPGSGKFADPSDDTCVKYIFCVPTVGGGYYARPYQCVNSYFDPNLQTCDKDYTCKTVDTTTRENRETTANLPSSLDYTSQTQVSNNELTTYSPETTSFFQTTASQEFRCLTSGRFANPFDGACETYYLCSKLRNETFLKTQYSCPKSKFDPNLKICSKQYICHHTQASSTEVPVTTTSQDIIENTTGTMAEQQFESTSSTTPNMSNTNTYSSTFTPHENTVIEKFTCTSKGKFPDATDKSCKGYILCSALRNGSFIETHYSCPYSYFDPILKACSTKYVCNTSQITVTIPAVTTEATTVSGHDFYCSKVGRFVNSNDQHCKLYYLCNQLRNGSFIQTTYPCPSSSIFDAQNSICSSKITCNNRSTITILN